MSLWPLSCGCGATEGPPDAPPPSITRPKGIDRPGEAERRGRFLTGTSAAEARELVETNNPANIDAVAAFFNDPDKPYAERVTALAALRSLRTQDAEEYRRAYDRVKDKLWIEASRGTAFSLSELEQRALVEALSWHADFKDGLARIKMEFYLDRDFVRTKRLPDDVLRAAALGLGKYPESGDAREKLWAALKDPKESGSVRASCLKALESFHPRDLTEKILELRPAAGDEWLSGLQRRLR